MSNRNESANVLTQHFESPDSITFKEFPVKKFKFDTTPDILSKLQISNIHLTKLSYQLD